MKKKTTKKLFFMLAVGSSMPDVSYTEPITLILRVAGKSYLVDNKGNLWILEMQARILRPEVESDMHPISTQGVVLSEEKVPFKSIGAAISYIYRLEFLREQQDCIESIEYFTARNEPIWVKEAEYCTDMYGRAVALIHKIAKKRPGHKKRHEKRKWEAQLLKLIVEEIEATVTADETINIEPSAFIEMPDNSLIAI